jgi:transposase
VDDWAWKKGRTPGTILVDLERRCVVDLLADRSADTLAAWLEAHRGVKIISRDRGGSYAEGARRGAPDAIQVADRFHLLTNLCDALERLLNRNHTVLPSLPRTADESQTTIQLGTSADTTVAATETIRASLSSDQPDEAGEIAQATSPAPSLADSASHAPEVHSTKDQQFRQQRRARRLQRNEEVMRLHDEGVSVRQIAQQLGMGRQTVRRQLNHGALPEIAQRCKMHSILDRWAAYLLTRWQSGCHNYQRMCKIGLAI